MHFLTSLFSHASVSQVKNRIDMLEKQMQDDVAETARRIHSTQEGLSLNLDSAVLSLQGRCEEAAQAATRIEVQVKTELQEEMKREMSHLHDEIRDTNQLTKSELRLEFPTLVAESESRLTIQLNELGAAMELIPPQIDAVRQATESKFTDVASQLRDMREWEVQELEKASKALATAEIGLRNDIQKAEAALKNFCQSGDSQLDLKIKKIQDEMKENANIWEAIERAESTAKKSKQSPPCGCDCFLAPKYSASLFHPFLVFVGELVIERFVLEINTIKGEVNTIVDQVEKRFDTILNEVLPSARESFDSHQP